MVNVADGYFCRPRNNAAAFLIPRKLSAVFHLSCFSFHDPGSLVVEDLLRGYRPLLSRDSNLQVIGFPTK